VEGAEFAPCPVEGGVAGGFRPYAEVPWQTFLSPDVMKGKPTAQFVTTRVILVPMSQTQPVRLVYDGVALVEGSAGAITAPAIEYDGEIDQMVDPVLRVMRNKLVVADSSRAPDPERVVKAHTLQKDPSELEAEIPELDEMDAMNQGLDEPDVPSVDLV